MAITGAAAVGPANTAAGATGRTVGGKLDQEAFLQILVSQLQNQDPTNPMNDTEYIAQLAQFSVLEQVQTLNANYSFGQASSLVGKNVYARTTGADGSEKEIFGQVTSVMTSGGTPYLEVNGEYIPYGQNIVGYNYSDPLAPQAGDQTAAAAGMAAANP